ncbi:MAG: hypothetical protein ACREAL_04910 [Nitrosopumilaceae archaeon]
MHKESLKLVFSNLLYLILTGVIFAGMLVLLLHTRELLFFEPFFVFYLPQDSNLSFGLIIITSGLIALVISMATYRIKTVGASTKKMGTGILGSVVGAGAGICTACSPVGFAVLSTFGATAATTLSFLTIHEIPIRIIAIAILIGTYFLMVKPKSICILNSY